MDYGEKITEVCLQDNRKFSNYLIKQTAANRDGNKRKKCCGFD